MFNAIVVGRWSVLVSIFHVCLHLWAWFFFLVGYVVLTRVRYREIFRRHRIYLDISSQIQNLAYGHDISIYRSLWYPTILDMISRCIAIHHAISHQITPKQQASKLSNAVCFASLSLPSFWLLFRPSRFFFVVLLCYQSPGHILRGLTGPPEKKTAALPSQGPAPWAHVLFVSFICFFPPLIFSFPVFSAVFVRIISIYLHL